MLSENDLSEIEMCLAAITTEDRAKLLGDAAVAEIRALRQVAEAAIKYAGGQLTSNELHEALEKAGYA